MLTVSDLVKPVEWGKSFLGDDLPPGPATDYYTGFYFSLKYYYGDVEYVMELYEEFGPVFTTRMMGLKIVWLIGAEANQYMYVDNWRDFYWWGESIEGHLAGLIGEGILSSVDDKHDKARKLLDPVFSKENLRNYVKGMIDVTESEVDQLRDGDRFDFYEWVYDLALLNASDCFMGMDGEGVDIGTLHDHFEKCVQYYRYPQFIQTLRGPGTPYRTFANSKEKIDEILYEEIKERRQKKTSADDNILDRLLQAEVDGHRFSNEEIHDQIITLYWAGHDTTISAVSWLMLMLGKYPDVYDKVRTELDERVGDGPVDADEVIDGLPYLEMVMDETLRLYPPAWVAQRKAREPFEMYGYEIPAHTELAFSSYATHRLPQLYDRPEAFDPQRMRPEHKRDFPPGAYIPFGRGPRTCIGMNFAKHEIKLIVATLMRHFDFELAPGEQVNGYPVATYTPDSVRIQLSRHENGYTKPSDAQPSKPTETGLNQPEGSSDDEGSGECPVH